ncbi:MAG: hypothetical protein P8X55_04100 [Desulfosarcinaceae bacterium]
MALNQLELKMEWRKENYMIGWRSGSMRIYGIFMLVAFLVLGSAVAVWSAEGDYDGTYAGTFTGDDQGYWVAIIDSGSESLFLLYSTVHNFGDGGYLEWAGESGTSANYYAYSELNNSLIDSVVDSSTGSVIGTWSNSTEGGTLSGAAMTSNDYAGTYSGTFSGDQSGTWSATIATDGYISGAMVLGGDSYSFRGGCHPEGYFSAVGEDESGDTFAVFARISGDSITGSWGSESGDSGSVTGSTSDATGGGDGGGGSGGCFIQSLISR